MPQSRGNDRKGAFRSNADFWITKLRRNAIRDVSVTRTLEEQGWTVLRYWETDVKKNLDEIADAIVDEVRRNA